MQPYVDRILTTHTGSLPRPDRLRESMVLRDRGNLPEDRMALMPQCICDAVLGVVQRQVDAGIDIVNDGEMSKIGYATYVRERLTGFEGEGGSSSLTIGDLSDLPEFAERSLAGLDPAIPRCTGPIQFKGAAAVAEDLANLKAAVGKTAIADVFMTAAAS